MGKIRVSFVPQTVQGPCRAGLPFFMVMCWESFISRLSLHLTQYANSAMFSPPLVAVFDILIIYSDSANMCNSIGPFRGFCLHLFFEGIEHAGHLFCPGVSNDDQLNLSALLSNLRDMVLVCKLKRL